MHRLKPPQCRVLGGPLWAFGCMRPGRRPQMAPGPHKRKRPEDSLTLARGVGVPASTAAARNKRPLFKPPVVASRFSSRAAKCRWMRAGLRRPRSWKWGWTLGIRAQWDLQAHAPPLPAGNSRTRPFPPQSRRGWDGSSRNLNSISKGADNTDR